METVFKVGMEVYDQVNYPNKKGKVVDTEPAVDGDDYPIEVEFEGEYSSSCYTLDGRIDLEQIPTLSTKPYEIKLEGFEQKAPITTYESIRAESLKKGEYVAILNGLELPDEKTAKAFEALAKLIWLRDHYNEGWRPDWTDNSVKHLVSILRNRMYYDNSRNCSSIMSFKSKEIVDKFMKDQEELLEIAKPLL